MKVFNFTVFRILRSWKNETKKCSFLSFFRILRNREKRLCTVDYRIPKWYSQKQKKWISSHFGNSFQELKSKVSKLIHHFGNKKISERYVSGKIWGFEILYSQKQEILIPKWPKSLLFSIVRSRFSRLCVALFCDPIVSMETKSHIPRSRDAMFPKCYLKNGIPILRSRNFKPEWRNFYFLLGIRGVRYS